LEAPAAAWLLDNLNLLYSAVMTQHPFWPSISPRQLHEALAVVTTIHCSLQLESPPQQIQVTETPPARLPPFPAAPGAGAGHIAQVPYPFSVPSVSRVEAQSRPIQIRIPLGWLLLEVLLWQGGARLPCLFRAGPFLYFPSSQSYDPGMEQSPSFLAGNC
jgi:hypothetical protein